MKSRVAYLMSGSPHLPYLICSLWTLRKHWNGELIICAWPEALDLTCQIAEDHRLQISDVRERIPEFTERNGSCVNHSLDKIQMIQGMRGETDVVMYIDADTTIHNNIDPVMKTALDYGFAATQFNDWVSTGSKARNRLAKFEGLPGIDQSIVKLMRGEPWPSINSGVFAARPETPVLGAYYQYTLAAKKIFIADETALNLMQPLFCPLRQMVVVGDEGRWNCSPKFQSKRLDNEDVAVFHYHGDSCVRPETKCQRGFDLWWPIYQECLEQDVGNITKWKDKIKTKYLHKLENKLAETCAD